jgi:predicted amidohydrolase
MAPGSTRSVSIGLAQITGAPFAAEKNRELSVESARELFRRGADLAVLPELIVSGYVADRDRLLPIAEPLEGPTTSAWGALAAETGGCVVGGFCERSGDDLYNSVAAVGPAGILLHYRKLHPFRAEKACFRPGNLGLPVVEAGFGKLGVCVCYDLRFVEVVRALALDGAELICVPTAWVPGFDRERWDRDGFSPQARGALFQSNLSQVFVACASQAGRSDGLELLGSSLVCNPYGKPAIGPLPGDRAELAVVSVDLDMVRAAQSRDPLISPRADRRTDVYGLRLGDRTL